MKANRKEKVKQQKMECIQKKEAHVPEEKKIPQEQKKNFEREGQKGAVTRKLDWAKKQVGYCTVTFFRE